MVSEARVNVIQQPFVQSDRSLKGDLLFFFFFKQINACISAENPKGYYYLAHGNMGFVPRSNQTATCHEREQIEQDNRVGYTGVLVSGYKVICL